MAVFKFNKQNIFKKLFNCRRPKPCTTDAIGGTKEDLRLHQRQLHRRLSTMQRLHRHAGPAGAHFRGVLADDLGAKCLRDCYDYQSGGERKGKQQIQ